MTIKNFLWLALVLITVLASMWYITDESEQVVQNAVGHAEETIANIDMTRYDEALTWAKENGKLEWAP